MSLERSLGQSPEWAVEVEHLSRRFRGQIALDDVSLRIPVGAIFGLVGLNGAGKTTLLRHLVGAYKPQQGRVIVLGGDPVAHPEVVLKRVGYLTEVDSLPLWARVGDLIDFTRALYPTWDAHYARELCDHFALSRHASLASLSKGQRARVGLLVAIAHRPELLVLDEPSSGLDPIARGDILEAVIRTISQDGRTVLFSSHLLDEVDRVCDCVALLHEGRIIETLTAEQMPLRYREILGRVSGGDRPPMIDGAFGWRISGGEWSAVIAAEALADPLFEQRFGVLEHRELTLPRWFSAHVDPARNRHTASLSAEVIADA